MALQRPVLVAALAALVHAGGSHGEPLEPVLAAARDEALQVREEQVPAADGLALSRMSSASIYTMAPARSAAVSAVPALRPAEWLLPSTLQPSAEKGFAIGYGSDRRLSGHLYTAASGQGSESGSRCCLPDPASAPPGSRYAVSPESASVATMIRKLRTKGLKLELEDGWRLDAGARSREYSNSFLNSRVAHITLVRWWGDLSTAYSLQAEKRGGWNIAPSQSVQIGYALAPRTTVGVSYTTGQEIAFFGAQGMLKTEVRSIAFHGEHALRKEWSFSFDAGYYDHGDLPSHKAVRFAFRRSL